MRAPEGHLGIRFRHPKKRLQRGAFKHGIVVQKPHGRGTAREGMLSTPIAPAPEAWIAEIIENCQSGMCALKAAAETRLWTVVHDNHGVRLSFIIAKGFQAPPGELRWPEMNQHHCGHECVRGLVFVQECHLIMKVPSTGVTCESKVSCWLEARVHAFFH